MQTGMKRVLTLVLGYASHRALKYSAERGSRSATSMGNSDLPSHSFGPVKPIFGMSCSMAEGASLVTPSPPSDLKQTKSTAEAARIHDDFIEQAVCLVIPSK